VVAGVFVESQNYYGAWILPLPAGYVNNPHRKGIGGSRGVLSLNGIHAGFWCYGFLIIVFALGEPMLS
jgi:hypothetical protein